MQHSISLAGNMYHLGSIPRCAYLLEQQRLKCWVNSFPHVLNQHWLAQAHSPLNETQEVGLAQLDQLQACPPLHVANPSIGLALRVYHQRPPLALAHQNAIVHRHIICWQAPQSPVSHLGIQSCFGMLISQCLLCNDTPNTILAPGKVARWNTTVKEDMFT